MLTRRTALAATLALPAFVRHARAADEPRFALGIASGQPHAQGMVLWTRLTGPGLAAEVTVQWELAEDEGFERIAARGTEIAREEDAHSVHAEPAGLRPERSYWYRFTALGQRSAAGRTRTAPARDDEPRRFDFAIASCQRYDQGFYAAWQHAARESLDLVLFLGDYIYETASPADAVRRHEGGPVRTLAGYRARYAQGKSDPALQAAHAACPWLVIWDDHEVENDYAGLQGQRLQPDFAQQRAAAYQAWWEHMPLPKAMRPVDGRTRIYGRLDWGRLARIHLVDDRQMRDVQVCPRPGRGGSNTVALADCPELNDPKRTLLGAEQERWLAEGWSLDHPWNLLAQQTLMAPCRWDDPPSEGGRFWTDGWDGYPAARQRLLSAVVQRKVPGCVVLGGDVHANVVADLKHEGRVVASEFCGTSISSNGLAQSRYDGALKSNAHLRYARADQRGYMRFTLERGELRAALRVLDDVRDPNSGIRTAAQFSVQAGRPGVVG